MGIMHRWLVYGIILLLLPSCAATPPAPAGAGDNVGKVAGAEKLGIRVNGIRSTANGYMLDFRYRVEDPVKSAPMFDRSVKPCLIDETTGAKFLVPSPPKVGPLRQTTPAPEAGRIYFILFANPGKYVQPGSLVTVAIGEHRLEHLIVE